MGTLSGIVDLDRYPIDQPESESFKKLVDRCRSELRREGAYVLEGFLTTEAIGRAGREGDKLTEKAYCESDIGDAYLEPEVDPDLAPDHPKRWTGSTRVGVIAYDQIPKSDTLCVLYESAELLRFLEQALNRGTLYRYNCTLGALNLAIMKKGDHVRWHFDQSNFVVSLAIRQSEKGGEFEYVPYVRSEEDPNYDGVKKLLEGETREGIKTLVSPSGSLVLFEGRQTLHRVTPIEGESSRLLGLLGFVLDPKLGSSPYLKRIRYGREH